MSEREHDGDDRSGSPGSGLAGWQFAQRAGIPDPIRPDRWIVGRFNQICFAFDGVELRLAVWINDRKWSPGRRRRWERSRSRK